MSGQFSVRPKKKSDPDPAKLFRVRNATLVLTGYKCLVFCIKNTFLVFRFLGRRRDQDRNLLVV